MVPVAKAVPIGENTQCTRYNWSSAIEAWDRAKIRAGWEEHTSPELPLELIAGTSCAQPPGLPPPAPAPAPEEGKRRKGKRKGNSRLSP